MAKPGKSKVGGVTGTRAAKTRGRPTKRGGAEGAHQGGASRGASRLEPSHQREAMMRDRPGGRKRPPAEGP